MAERDPATLNAVEEVQIQEFAAAKTKAKRKKLFGALAAGVALVGGGYSAMDALVWSKHAVTDNAYVGADVAQVTSQLAAPVSAVLVEDTQQVRRGDVLGPARRHGREDRGRQCRGQSRQRDPQGAGPARDRQRPWRPDRGPGCRPGQGRGAASRLPKPTSKRPGPICSVARRSLRPGAVSQDELTSVRTAYDNAAAALRAAQAAQAQAAAARNAAVGDRNANLALIANVTVDNNPEVLAARAALDQARVDLSRTVIRAPDRRRRVPAPGPGRPARSAGRRADDRRSGPVGLCRRQLQGGRAQQGQARPAGRADLRPLRRGCRLPRPGGRLLRRHRRGVRARPGAERDRQLDQGGPAPAGPHRARSDRNSPRTRCASAFR